MSKTILGNNNEPILFNIYHETEVDDDVYEDLEGEIVDSYTFYGYRVTCPKKSESNKITIYFYYYAPTSDWYWGYDQGIPYKPLIPLVFTVDSDWNLTECLNYNIFEVTTQGRKNGWFNIDVTLKRQILEGEKIVFGVYSDLHGFVSSVYEAAPSTQCYEYWTTARRKNFNSQIAYVSSPEYINQSRNIWADYEVCLYLQYENQPDGIFYSRSVTTNTELNAIFAKRKLGIKRAASNECLLNSTSNRFASFRVSKTEKISLSDFVIKFLLLIRTCVINIVSNDSTKRTADYKKSIASTASNSESVTRFGENFRSFEDKSNITALPFASRIFYRTVKTVMSFWDWLSGKIREANFVVSFFTPVVLEIKLDGKNMQKIYKGKSKLRILLDCRCDLTGYEKVKLAARKPDDTLVTFPAVVKDAENGIIFYDTQSESDIDQVGWWTFWPEFVFDDDRTSCGSAYRTFVYEVGT